MVWEEIRSAIILEKGEKILDVCEGSVETPASGREKGVFTACIIAVIFGTLIVAGAIYKLTRG